MKHQIIAANWKMNGREDSLRGWLDGFSETIGDVLQTTALEDFELVVSLPSTLLSLARQEVQRLALSEFLKLAAQDVSVYGKDGAFTGEISASMLKDVGCEYVIVGHSERRHLMKESNSLCAEKFEQAIQTGLKPIFCVGETLEERESGQIWSVIESQLSPIEPLLEKQESGFVVAYEPVWAIGTGQNATPSQVESVHQLIQAYLSEKAAGQGGQIAPILYGGSVKPANAQQIFEVNAVNGGLIGGASLKVDSFLDIVTAFLNAKGIS